MLYKSKKKNMKDRSVPSLLPSSQEFQHPYYIIYADFSKKHSLLRVRPCLVAVKHHAGQDMPVMVCSQVWNKSFKNFVVYYYPAADNSAWQEPTKQAKQRRTFTPNVTAVASLEGDASLQHIKTPNLHWFPAAEPFALLQPRRMEVIMYFMSTGAYLHNWWLSLKFRLHSWRQRMVILESRKGAKNTMSVICRVGYKDLQKGYLK